MFQREILEKKNFISYAGIYNNPFLVQANPPLMFFHLYPRHDSQPYIKFVETLDWIEIHNLSYIDLSVYRHGYT